MIRYEMDMSLYSYERVVYGVLDLLGDVGGFIDALDYIGLILMYIFTFQPVNLRLVGRLFKFQENKGSDGLTRIDGTAEIDNILEDKQERL